MDSNWCSDRWHNNYNGAPCDGSSWETGGSENRVRRGGSWYVDAVFCRSASRNWDALGLRVRNCGFRVAVA
ncbi:formylglycine-generating enzyme family protein [Microseira wollei]|uniref:formylglycine-generating enzyme family protein n=1 Tax=Microseira wollei TaxID=467598 RepID=UPI0027D98EA4|nr:SUMF1/EgtB/PvdO family nonheme iron enzyme [Microseira wollei]